MPLEEPSWWYEPGRAPVVARALRPASVVYAWAVERRFRRTRPYRASLPVICIGNLTAGGTGKTPLAMRIAQDLIDMGERPTFLTRGYGGRTAGPHWVDPKSDTATAVGDEALLLAEIAPALVSRDRAAGARAIEAVSTASVIIMDDGLQNPSLCKDLTIALVDARRGIGNGEVLPMGPLRAGLGFQLGLVDAVVINHSPAGHGELQSQSFQWLESQFAGPVLAASPGPQGDVAWIKTARLIAFAGIANPQRFYRLLEMLGGNIATTVTLPDHHMFRQRDAERILSLAASHDAIPVTTEKDWVRLKVGYGAIGELFAHSRKLGIRLELKEHDAKRLDGLLAAALTRESST